MFLFWDLRGFFFITPPFIVICHFNFFFNKFIYLFYFLLCWVFVALHGLFSSCGERGLLFVAVRGFPIAVASLFAEHGP